MKAENITVYRMSRQDREELRIRLRELFENHCRTPYCRTCQKDFDDALAEFRASEGVGEVKSA